MKLSDKDFKKLKNADPDIFEKFYLEYRDIIYNYILIKTKGNTHLTEDVLGDTFHSALRSVGKLKNKDNLQGWIMQIAVRRLNDQLEIKYRDKKIQNAIENVGIENNTHEETLIKNEKILILNTAIKNLKPNYSEIIKLKYIEKKSQKDISLILNKHEKAVEGLLFRAREALKKEMHKISKYGFNN